MMSFGDAVPLAADSLWEEVCKWGPHHTYCTCKRGLELTDEDIWGNRWAIDGVVDKSRNCFGQIGEKQGG